MFQNIRAEDVACAGATYPLRSVARMPRCHGENGAFSIREKHESAKAIHRWMVPGVRGDSIYRSEKIEKGGSQLASRLCIHEGFMQLRIT